MKLIEYLKTDTFLRQFIMATLGFLILLNTFAVWALGDKLRIEPVEVLDAINERLEVTPKEVMVKLDVIANQQDANIARILKTATSTDDLASELNVIISRHDNIVLQAIAENRDAILRVAKALEDAAL